MSRSAEELAALDGEDLIGITTAEAVSVGVPIAALQCVPPRVRRVNGGRVAGHAGRVGSARWHVGDAREEAALILPPGTIKYPTDRGTMLLIDEAAKAYNVPPRLLR